MNTANQVCFRTLHHDKPWSLEAYQSVGGYQVWQKILREKNAARRDYQSIKNF